MFIKVETYIGFLNILVHFKKKQFRIEFCYRQRSVYQTIYLQAITYLCLHLRKSANCITYAQIANTNVDLIKLSMAYGEPRASSIYAI